MGVRGAVVAALVSILLAGLVPPSRGDEARKIARFPGPEKTIKDPTGRFAVVWVPADEKRPGSEQGLMLEDVSSGRTRPLRTFARWATVLWAPGGARLAATYGAGADGSEVWVYLADEAAAPLDVASFLERQHKNGLDFAAGADHRYLEAVRWVDPAILVVRIWGYGGKKPFDRELAVRLDD